MALQRQSKSPVDRDHQLSGSIQALVSGSRANGHEASRALQTRYEALPRCQRSAMLTQICQATGFHRKHVIRLLRRNYSVPRGRTNTRKPSLAMREILGEIYQLAGSPSVRELSAILPRWVQSHPRAQSELSASEQYRLMRMSPATISRLLRSGGKTPGALETKRLFDSIRAIENPWKGVTGLAAVGHIYIVLVNLISPEQDQPGFTTSAFSQNSGSEDWPALNSARGIMIMDASGRVLSIVASTRSPLMDLSKALSSLQNPMCAIHVEGDRCLTQAARLYAWGRESPIPLSIDSVEYPRLSLDRRCASPHFLVCYNLGRLRPPATAGLRDRVEIDETAQGSTPGLTFHFSRTEAPPLVAAARCLLEQTQSDLPVHA